MFALVGGLDEDEGPDRAALVLCLNRPEQRLLIAVYRVDREPLLLAKRYDRRVLRRSVAAHQMRGILFVDALGDLGNHPLVFLLGSEIAAHDPDDVRQVLESLADESPVLAKTLFAAGLHLSKEAVVSTAVAEIRGKQPHDDAPLVGLFHHFVSEIKVGWVRSREIAHLGKRSQPGPSLGRCRGELVLDQVDDDRVESSPLAVV